MDNKLPEGVKPINTFLNIDNTATSTTTNNSNDGGFLKSIGARFLNRQQSNRVYFSPDRGYDSINDVFDIEGGSILYENYEKFRTLSIDRYRQYATYEQMADDPIISSALDLYADDATQSDSNGNQIWINSDNTKWEQICNTILNGTKIPEQLWKIARSLAHYGDVYLELFYTKTDKSVAKLVESARLDTPELDYTDNILEVDKLVHDESDGYILDRIEIVPDIENIFDLRVKGETVAFARLVETNAYIDGKTGYISPKDNGGDVRYYPSDKFVHLFIDSSDKRNKDYYIIDLPGGYQFRFEIARGKSMIHDVFRINRDLQLLEYSVMLNRISKSSIFRFVKVHVGSQTKANIQTTLRKVKNLIESKISMNTDSGNYQSYLDPGPIENFIYFPVKDNNQGNIEVETVGGDINVRDIADIDYLLNKEFAGLKIPKTYLSFEEPLGMGAGTTLTKQDARYARTVKRLQKFMLIGFTKLMDIYLDNRGLSYLKDNYVVQMVPPASAEDEERDTQFNNKIELVKNFLDMAGQVPEGVIDTKKLIEYISDDILNAPVVKDIITVPEAQPVASEDMETSGGGNLDFGGGGGMDFGGGPESEPMEFETASPSEITTEPAEVSGGTEEFSGEWEDLG